jgi:hypothetical protein
MGQHFVRAVAGKNLSHFQAMMRAMAHDERQRLRVRVELQTLLQPPP